MTAMEAISELLSISKYRKSSLAKLESATFVLRSHFGAIPIADQDQFPVVGSMK